MLLLLLLTPPLPLPLSSLGNDCCFCCSDNDSVFGVVVVGSPIAGFPVEIGTLVAITCITGFSVPADDVDIDIGNLVTIGEAMGIGFFFATTPAAVVVVSFLGIFVGNDNFPFGANGIFDIVEEAGVLNALLLLLLLLPFDALPAVLNDAEEDEEAFVGVVIGAVEREIVLLGLYDCCCDCWCDCCCD